MDVASLSDQIAEVSEVYARKFDIERDDVWFLLKLQEEMGELVQSYLAMQGKTRAREQTSDELAAAFRAEVADVLCQVLLLARCHDVDVVAEVEKKWLCWRSQ